MGRRTKRKGGNRRILIKSKAQLRKYRKSPAYRPISRLSVEMIKESEKRKSEDYRKKLKELGHRYFIDDYREASTKMISNMFHECWDDCWFWTGTYNTGRLDRNNAHSFWRGWKKFDISSNLAERIYREYIRRLDQAVRTNNGGACRLRVFLVNEYQLRGCVHHHAIVYAKGLSSRPRRRWEARWNKVAGQCRIEKADPRVAPYLAKRLGKDADLQVLIDGDWRGRTIAKL